MSDDDATGSDARIDDDDDAGVDDDGVRGETRGEDGVWTRKRRRRTMAGGVWLGKSRTKRGGGCGRKRRVCDACVVVDGKM